MFAGLSERLSASFRNLRGRGVLSEENIEQALREVRMALLEADVALPVVREFLAQVKTRALGKEVLQSLTPDQAFIKVVNDALVEIMGGQSEALHISANTPSVVLVAGLQGAGKTTTVGKLAGWLMGNQGRSVMVASADIYRPAAIEQLRLLAEQVGAAFYAPEAGAKPAAIATEALAAARRAQVDLLLFDSAGRLHIDEPMMAEIKQLHELLTPAETLFVVDSMTGQDAATSAKAFGDALPLSGVVLTKMDGDARGGAALSVRHITGKPIKFVGTGEKLDALEVFHPERIASRILGMGDVVTLVEEVERKIDRGAADKLARKVKQGKGFDLEDFRQQLRMLDDIGGIGGVVKMLPGVPAVGNDAATAGTREMKRIDAIICSMTSHERRQPGIIRGSRKRRIAAGSGTQVQDVNRLLKQFVQMQKMMKKMGKRGGLAGMMRGLGGRMPPGRPS